MVLHILAIFWAPGVIFAGVVSPHDGIPQKIDHVFAAYFNEKPGYRNGDLINRADFDALIPSLYPKSPIPPEVQSLRERVLPDDAELRKLFRGKQGKAFMRRIAPTSGGYSQLELLSQTPGGNQLTSRLSHQPGGEDLVAYLATTKGGKRLSKKAGRMTGSRKSTKMAPLYTADQLKQALANSMLP